MSAENSHHGSCVTTRQPVRASLLQGLGLFIALCGASLAGAQPFDPFLTLPGASSVTDDGPLKQPRLYWKSGESIDGQLLSADDHSLVWQASLFAEPLQLRTSSLLRVEFPPVSAKVPAGPFSILFKNGDRLYSDISGINADGLTLNSERHGEIKVPLTAVQAIERLQGEGIVYSGPTGAAGWKHFGQRDPMGFPWISGEHGAMLTRVWNRTATLDLPLPDKMALEIVLSSPFQPQFALGFSTSSVPSATIETWEDELVIDEQNRFAPLRTLTSEDRCVALRVFWDRPAKKIQVYDWEGTLLGDFTTEQNEPGKPGIMLHNKGTQLTLEHLTVRAWDGSPCPKRDVKQGWLQLAGGATQEGSLTAAAGGIVVTPVHGAASSPVPFAKITALDLGPLNPATADARKLPLPQMAIKLPPAEALPSRIRFGDGTLLTGTLVEIKEGAVLLRTAAFTQPVAAKLDGMTRIALNEPVPLSTPPDKPLAQLDVLHVGTSYLHGTFEGSGDAILRWRAVGGLQPTAVSTVHTDLEIRRAATGEGRQAPALFFMSDDNVLSGELKNIDAEGVQLASAVATVKSLKNEQLHAIHFNTRKTSATGFSDPGWQIVKGSDKEAHLKDNKLVLNDGGAFGHPSILAGDEISFTLSLPNFWGALAVELFVGDLETRNRAAQMHLIYSGTDFWAVLEDTENNSRSSEQLRNLTRRDINVRMVFDEGSVLLFANDMMVMSAPISQDKRKGSGLIFSPSTMWGSPVRDVVVSNFGVKARPDYLQVPAIGEEARRNALRVPRFRRESPPTHAVLAPNGDLLRGRIESATDSLIRFTSGLDAVDIPTEHVAAAVWLTKPVDPKAPAPPTSPLPAAPFLPTHWLTLQDGSRLALRVDRFERDAIVGTAPLLGACRIPASQLAVLRLSALTPSTAMLAYRNWQLEYAPEPVLPETGGESSPLLHKTAPAFALPLLGGGQFDLNAERGHVVVLDFWATWCGPCVAAMPENLKTMAQFDPLKVKFIAVNQGEPEPQVAKFLQARGWQMQVAMDAQQDIGRKYGVESIPHQVIIGPTGNIEWINTGFTPGMSEKMAGVIKKLIGTPVVQ